MAFPRQANRTGRLEKGYLENSRTGKILRFQYNPEMFSDDNSVDYREIKAPGITYPIYQYVGGEPRSIEFTLLVDNTDNKGESINKVRETISFLTALLPPHNKHDRYTPPPQAIFAFGWFVKPVILVSMPVRYTMFDRSLQPLRAEIDLTFRIIQ